MSWIRRTISYLEGLNNLLVIADGVLISVLTVVIVYGVTMRYVFDSPVTWVTEFCLYMIVFVIFLPVPFLQQGGRHIRVDAVVSRLPRRKQTWLSIFSSAVSLFAFIIFTWSLTVYTHRAFVNDWHIGVPSGLYWSMFPIVVIIPVCGFLLSLQLLIGMVRDIATLFAGQQEESPQQGTAGGN